MSDGVAGASWGVPAATAAVTRQSLTLQTQADATLGELVPGPRAWQTIGGI
jgi:hypothetical protein